MELSLTLFLPQGIALLSLSPLSVSKNNSQYFLCRRTYPTQSNKFGLQHLIVFELIQVVEICLRLSIYLFCSNEAVHDCSIGKF
jgi:hypothetical protein